MKNLSFSKVSSPWKLSRSHGFGQLLNLWSLISTITYPIITDFHAEDIATGRKKHNGFINCDHPKKTNIRFSIGLQYCPMSIACISSGYLGDEHDNNNHWKLKSIVHCTYRYVRRWFNQVIKWHFPVATDTKM